MRDLFDKEFQKEMDDFFDYIDYEVLGRAADDEADDMDRDARFAADADDDEVKQAIEDTVREYEPRAELISVFANQKIDNNALTITIKFRVVNQTDPIIVNVFLERVR